MVGCFASAQSSDPKVAELERLFAYSETAPPLGVEAKPRATEETGELELRYHEFRVLQQQHKIIECGILALLALVAQSISLWFITRTTHNAAHLMNATGLVYIIFGTIILVLIATTEQQLTAAIGILGTVAGYLFGTLHRATAGRDLEPRPAKGAHSGLASVPPGVGVAKTS